MSFCWFPPDSASGARLEAARRGHAGQRAADPLGLAAAADEAEPGEPADAGQADVFADRSAEHEAVVLPRLRDQGDPRVECRAWVAGERRRTRADLRGADGHRTEDRPGHLRTARTDKPCEPDDLAGPDLERDAVDPGCGEVPDAQRDGRIGGRRLLRRVRARDRAAEHRRDERVLRFVRGRAGSDDLAVAQDRHGVGELEHLAEEMRDEDDRPSACRQAPDDLVEALDLRRRQRSGRLVEDDELGVTGKRPEDLDLLLRRERQRPDRRVRRHLEAGASDDAPEPIEELPTTDEAEPSWLGAEEHVLGDRPLRDQRDFLGNHRDPALERRARRSEATGSPRTCSSPWSC